MSRSKIAHLIPKELSGIENSQTNKATPPPRATLTALSAHEHLSLLFASYYMRPSAIYICSKASPTKFNVIYFLISVHRIFTHLFSLVQAKHKAVQSIKTLSKAYFGKLLLHTCWD